MLNVGEIKKVLESTPLCNGALMKVRGMTKEYCAVGALAKGVGASDKYLSVNQPISQVFNDFRKEFKERYGITSISILESFMNTNDRTPSVIHRTKAVEDTLEDKQIDEINKAVNDLIKQTELSPVTANV